MVGAAKGDDGGGVGLGDAEVAGEFALEVEEGALGGGFFIEVGEGAGEEVVEFGGGVVVFGGEFEEFYEVGGECEAGVVAAEAVAGVAEADFAEGMEFGFFAAGVGDFAVEEEVEDACEWAFGAECAFGDGFDFPVIESEPGDDEAGVAESRFAEEDGACGFQFCGMTNGWDERGRPVFLEKNHLRRVQGSVIARDPL